MKNSVFARVPATRVVLYLFLMLWAWLGMQSIALGQNGRLEQGQIFSKALTNNLLGDSAQRPFSVYLPPSYDWTQKRYPVVYMLHGYGMSDSDTAAWLEPSLDSMTTARTIGEMIVVFVNATNRLWGSQYLSSPVIGDYETYLAKDLVAYIDAHYRTLATRNSRGITGVSMGGWGSMRLALKFPDVFSVVVPDAGYYDMVGDLDFAWRQTSINPPTTLAQFDQLSFPANWVQSVLAGLLPDLQRPELYTDYPYTLVNGQLVPVDTAMQRLRDGDVAHGDLGRYLKQPVRLNAIKIVHGINDDAVPISWTREFTNTLTAAGVQFTYEEHSGGHTYVPELSWPFLSANLQGIQPYAGPATFSVTSLNDSGPGSLRQAINDAISGDTITFSVTGTMTLTSGTLTITKSLDIEGPGPNKLTISGNHASRVFVIPSGTVTIAGMTIRDGLADASSPMLPSIGGGILNLASLTLSNNVVSDNLAVGDKGKAPLGFPGLGAGGGLGNVGASATLAVIGCSFSGNVARGGDGSTSMTTLAGPAMGGGIANVGYLAVTGSAFSQNQAIGANGNVGPILSGHGIGGAIGSGGTPGTTLVVSSSKFDHNLALGGNGNQVPSGVPSALGPNKGSGGAIDVFGGTGTINGCTLEHNLALGGSSANGGGGLGGGMTVTDVSGTGTTVTISDSLVQYNMAVGGRGGPGGAGGEGAGGGLTSVSGAKLTIVSATVEHNLTQGGRNAAGWYGGNGLGGGLYEDAGRAAPLAPGPSTLILTGSTVSFNLALGSGEAEDGVGGGQGIGGGVYRLGTYSADSATVIATNQASTRSDNLAP